MNKAQQALNQALTPAMVPLGALAAGFGLGLLAGPALAQTPPAAEDDPVLPEVTIRSSPEESARQNLQTTTTTLGKGTQEIRDVPQSMSVVTEKLIDDAKLDTLKQALHYTSGITFAATENGTDQDIRLRGFPVASTGDLLLDGMRDPSQYDRDTFNYDRIEILRGSASMLYGRGSTGGIINQVTKKPALINLSEVIVTGGTGDYYRLTGDLNVRTDEYAALRLNAMATRAYNYGAKVEKYGIAPSYTWGLDTPDEINLSLFHLNVDNIPMSNLRYLRGSVADAIRPRNFYGTRSDFLTGEATYGQLSWRHRLQGGGELRSQVRAGVYARSAWGTTAGYCSNPLTSTGSCPEGSFPVTAETLTADTAMTRSGLTPRKDRFKSVYAQSDYSRTYGWFGLRHEVLAGVDLAYETVDRFGSFGAVRANYNKGGTRVGTPNDGATTLSVPMWRPSSNYQATTVGAFAQDLVSLAPHWKLLGGLRLDRFEADNGQIIYATNGAVTGTAATKITYDALFSHRWGLLYQPTRTRSYHVSFGTSFNTSADTYQYTTPAVAEVPAERSRNIEAGAKLDWLEGALSTRFSLFRTDKYHERTVDQDFAGTSYTLSGQRHSQGLDLEVVGRVTPRVEVYASYTWVQKAVIDKAGIVIDNEGTINDPTGQPVGLSPRHSGAIWLGFRATPQLRLGLGVRGAAENHPLTGGTGAALQTVKAPGYVAYDAMAEYRFNEDLFLQLNLNNLTDKVYGDQLYPTFYVPGEGRSVRLSLGVRF